MKTENRKFALVILIAGLMALSAMSFIPAIAGEDPQPQPLAAFTSAIVYGTFDDVNTWGGGGFPTSGDTFTILTGHTVNVTGAELSGSGTIDAGGTLAFNCTGGIATLTLDNGATLANSGTINETLSTIGNYAAIVGTSSEAITGTQPAWSDGFWRFAEIDFQMAVVTGGGGCRIDIDGSCVFDAVTITAADTFDINAQRASISGNFDSSAGTIVYGTGTIQLTDTLVWTTAAGQDYYDVLVDITKTVTMAASADILGTLTVNGVVAGAQNIFLKGSVAKPFVIGGSGDVTATDTIDYQGTGAPTTVEDTTYSTLGISGDGITHNLEGAVICSVLLDISAVTNANTALLDTTATDYGITSEALSIGTSGSTKHGTLKCRDSIIDIGAGGIDTYLTGLGTIDADTSTISSAGDFEIGGLLTSDTCTIVINGTTAPDQTVTSGGDAFYNLTINNTHATADVELDNMTVTNNFTVTDGTVFLTLNGTFLNFTRNVTLSNTATVTMGASTWYLNGTLDQTMTLGTHNIPTLRINNADNSTIFVNDTNVTTMVCISSSTIVLQDDMTINALTATGTSFSSNSTTDRYLFVPLANRTLATTYFYDVNLVPTQVGQQGGSAPTPTPEIPEASVTDDPLSGDAAGETCWSTFGMIGLVGICVGGSIMAYMKDPRRGK